MASLGVLLAVSSVEEGEEEEEDEEEEEVEPGSGDAKLFVW